jgi:GTP cyclohydrolase I
MNSPAPKPIADVQNQADTRHLAINKVGIKSIRHPVVVKDKSVGVQHTIATFNMYVHLPHDFKGTHMSRFVEILNQHGREISVESFQSILREMVEKLEAKSGYIEMSFPYFVNKTAPVSDVQSLLDYDVTFIGEIDDGQYRFTMKVLGTGHQPVPLLQENFRSRRAQPALARYHHRAHQTLGVDRRSGALCRRSGVLRTIWIAQAPDEKFVTERAYDNPKFVEDMVRDVAAALNDDERIEAYVVESENFESIHNHSAYALIERDKTVKG